MRRAVLALVAALLAAATWARPEKPPRKPPRLAVFLVVDQLRADYLTRFASRLDGGLRRLQREGFVFDEAHQEHAVTETGPGHASLATGLPPSRHGIIGNRWFEAGKGVGCVDDPEIAGHFGGLGASPQRLLAPTLAEWIKRASPESRVIAVSGKDRSAILMAGRVGDGVFWYDTKAGGFTTSTFYAKEPPEPLRALREAGALGLLACRAWERLDGPNDLPEADADDRPWEPEGDRTFPHKLPCPATGTPTVPPSAELLSALRFTPFFDDKILELAEGAIERYRLGADATPDLLTISLSATDFVGHRFGPDSQEVLDQVRRLDRRLAQFFERLDRKVGLDRTLIVLSADHGVAACPEHAPAGGAQRVKLAEVGMRLKAALRAGMGEDVALPEVEGSQIYFKQSSDKLEQVLADALRNEAWVAHVYRRSELASSAAGEDRFLPLMRASWTAGRGGDLMVLQREGWLLSSAGSGSDHGTPYEYDSHVPLIFRGSGIAPGHSAERVAVYRAAPTIAKLLGVPAPADLPDGPLPQVGR
ncbi:MAG TPA: alkaline phosphatase family protein [Candidatus Polarisedimenticolaceae bacterium]|nr:alkaline phosphatase family protein [Candidatus Polarisedimenticolaceae bacterium]